jgi:TIR domain
MADVFLSYSHKDTDIVRDLVRFVEAEGFSVWWDHTIPPGKTWDDVIARGIREAKACIIVWSPDSVISDWVKEEATLAKEGGKYLPIQVGTDQPPMGFRRIQAANLSQWKGNAQDPQWRLLITEVAHLVRGEGAGTSAPVAAPPSVVPARIASNAAPRSGKRTGLYVGLGTAAIACVGALGLWYGSRARSTAAVPPATAVTPTTNVAPTSAAPSSMVGVWQGWYHLDTDPPDQRTPLTGTFQADGSMVGQSGGRTSLWHWQQSGSTAQWSNGSTTYTATVTGNHMAGTISYGDHSGNFEANR